MTAPRPATALLASALITLSLAGCSLLAPTRNADGTIVGDTPMPSTDAWVGDCFSFVEGSNLSYATVTPCSEDHTHIVVAKGSLSQAKLSLFESLQIAVITACEPTFDAWVAAQAASGAAPEYIVSTEKMPGGTVTHYSCLATDGAA